MNVNEQNGGMRPEPSVHTVKLMLLPKIVEPELVLFEPNRRVRDSPEDLLLYHSLDQHLGGCSTALPPPQPPVAGFHCSFLNNTCPSTTKGFGMCSHTCTNSQHVTPELASPVWCDRTFLLSSGEGFHTDGW